MSQNQTIETVSTAADRVKIVLAVAAVIAGVVGFYLAYMCWFTLLKQCRMDEAAPFILLMPVVGIITAALVLGESVSLEQLIGGAVILAGLAIVSGVGLPSRKRSEAASGS